MAAPFWFGATAVAVGVVIMGGGLPTVRRALRGEAPAEHSDAEAEAISLGDAG